MCEYLVGESIEYSSLHEIEGLVYLYVQVTECTTRQKDVLSSAGIAITYFHTLVLFQLYKGVSLKECLLVYKFSSKL